MGALCVLPLERYPLGKVRPIRVMAEKKTVCPLDQVCLGRVIDERVPLDEQKTPSGCRSQDTTKTQAKNALTSALTWTFARSAELAS